MVSRVRSNKSLGGVVEHGNSPGSQNNQNNQKEGNNSSPQGQGQGQAAFDVRESRVLAIMPPSDAVTPCVFTVHSSPIGGHAELLKASEPSKGALLERFDLGRSDLRVTAAGQKLALYVHDESKPDDEPQAVILVCGSANEAVSLAKLLCASVFATPPVIRGTKEESARLAQAEKENQPRQIQKPSFPKAGEKKVISHWGAPPQAKAPKGNRGRDRGSNSRASLGLARGESDLSMVSRGSHSQYQGISNGNGNGSPHSAQSAFSVERRRQARQRRERGRKKAKRGQGGENEDSEDSDDSDGDLSGLDADRGYSDEDTVNTTNTANTANTRKSKASVLETEEEREKRKREQWRKFKKRDEELTKKKHERSKEKGRVEQAKAAREEEEQELYKLKRDVIVMRAREKKGAANQQLHVSLF